MSSREPAFHGPDGVYAIDWYTRDAKKPWFIKIAKRSSGAISPRTHLFILLSDDDTVLMDAYFTAENKKALEWLTAYAETVYGDVLEIKKF